MGWATFWAIFSQTHLVTLLQMVQQGLFISVPANGGAKYKNLFFLSFFFSPLVCK
jgi:hypothetical protein